MIDKNDQFRNIALVAHSGAGKTFLSEVMLFNSGTINRIGHIEDGNTIMDFEPEEIKRQTSISSGFYNFSWKKKILNIIDTPGDQNFISDAKLCMQAADGVLILIDGVDGIKVQTEMVWEFSKDFNQPCVLFINKLDKERSNFVKVLNSIKKFFFVKSVVVELPIGNEKNFNGIVNLISLKAFIYQKDGTVIESGIPETMQDEVDIYREALIESIAETDDVLIEKYLNGEEFSEEEINEALRNATLSRLLIPIVCGSAIRSIGIDLLLDFVSYIFPSPIEVGVRKGINPDNDEVIERNPDFNDPFSAFVIKTVSDPYAGRLSIFRVVSGMLTSDGVFYNSNKCIKERYNQLLSIVGKEQKVIDCAGPGSLVAVPKLRETRTGDTLCDNFNKIIYECAKPIHPLISFAVESKNKSDEDKIYISLLKLLEEDTSLMIDRHSETKEIILSGLGQVHIENALEKLKRKYKIDAKLMTPKIPYRETIKNKVRIQGKYKKQSGGHGQFGDCWIVLEPLPTGSGFEFVNAIVGGAIPKQYIPAVEKGIIEAAEHGILTGFPCVDFKATCDFGSYHSVDSSEMAFKIAGSIAFKKACEEANPVILEPIMKVTIVTPGEFTGDVMGDLNSRRGKVLGIENKDKIQIINAEIPIAEIQTYAPDLRSITAGYGTYCMEFCRYDELPATLFESVIEKVKSYKKR